MKNISTLPALFSTLIVITLSLFCYLIVSNHSENEVDKNTQSILTNQLCNSVIIHGRNIKMAISKNAILTDQIGQQFAITKIFDKKKIIFRIQEINCFDCIEKYLPYLNRLIKKYGKENIIILGTFNRPKLLFLQLKNYTILTDQIYNISYDFISNKELEKENVPYVFQMDSTLEAHNIFIPNKDVPQLSKFYEDFLIIN